MAQSLELRSHHDLASKRASAIHTLEIVPLDRVAHKVHHGTGSDLSQQLCRQQLPLDSSRHHQKYCCGAAKSSAQAKLARDYCSLVVGACFCRCRCRESSSEVFLSMLPPLRRQQPTHTQTSGDGNYCGRAPYRGSSLLMTGEVNR